MSDDIYRSFTHERPDPTTLRPNIRPIEQEVIRNESNLVARLNYEMELLGLVKDSLDMTNNITELIVINQRKVNERNIEITDLRAMIKKLIESGNGMYHRISDLYEDMKVTDWKEVVEECETKIQGDKNGEI